MDALPPTVTPRPVRFLCLTGFMASGKSTVARLLARQAGWTCADLDQQIVEAAGRDIPEIFARFGEPAFRRLEREALERSIAAAQPQGHPTVISLGGGTTVQPGNLALLRAAGAVLIWLDCPVEELLTRAAQLTNRPLFRDEAGFRQLYKQRLPFYAQAHHRVDAAKPPLRVVEQILSLGIFAGVRA